MVQNANTALMHVVYVHTGKVCDHESAVLLDGSLRMSALALTHAWNVHALAGAERLLAHESEMDNSEFNDLNVL